MNHLTKEYVTKLKDSLLFINAVVIIYNFINEIKRKR